MARSTAFCLTQEQVEEAIIKLLHKDHPDALPISIEWELKTPRCMAIIWWNKPSEKQ